jgi:group II intron reverse transcriptase/maturase
LYAKAKESPNLRFYSLADKMYREDVLRYAYESGKRNGGAPGVDGQTFEDIESYGVNLWVSELAETLRSRSYRPDPVLRCYIPKDNGKERPLGIPTIRDRVAQTAGMVVLLPIFEADLQPEQYAYRPKRSAHDAIRTVHALVSTGHTEVVDADLSGYFDTIPHAELMKSVSRRISDGWMLKLIKMWLKMPVVEADKKGLGRRKPASRDPQRGTPQGAPISPLLANIYMRRFILGWKQLGLEDRLKAHIVNYADDCAPRRRGNREERYGEA